MGPVEAIRQGLASKQSSVRAAELERLDRTRHDAEGAKNVLPELLEHFGQEVNPKLKRLAARLIVRFADSPCHSPGLVEELTAALSKAKTRDQTHSALVSLRAAAARGWSLSPANPLLVDFCSTQWNDHALDILIIEASRGVDVLSCNGIQGVELWETLKFLLEFQIKRYDTRIRALQLILASARHRRDHLTYYTGDIELAVADQRMSDDFKKVAAECLQMLQAAAK